MKEKEKINRLNFSKKFNQNEIKQKVWKEGITIDLKDTGITKLPDKLLRWRHTLRVAERSGMEVRFV